MVKCRVTSDIDAKTVDINTQILKRNNYSTDTIFIRIINERYRKNRWSYSPNTAQSVMRWLSKMYDNMGVDDLPYFSLIFTHYESYLRKL